MPQIPKICFIASGYASCTESRQAGGLPPGQIAGRGKEANLLLDAHLSPPPPVRDALGSSMTQSGTRRDAQGALAHTHAPLRSPHAATGGGG